jgi:hypothetical protein
VNITVKLVAPASTSPEQQRDQLVAASYLLDNIARRIGNGEQKGELVNRAFDVEAQFTVLADT